MIFVVNYFKFYIYTRIQLPVGDNLATLGVAVVVTVERSVFFCGMEMLGLVIMPV